MKGQLPPSVTTADLKARTDLFIKAVNQLAMESLLSELQTKNLRLVICSDNTEFWFRRQFEKLGLQRFFAEQDCFLSSRVGVSKHSPGFEMLRAITQALGIEKSFCLFIDDRRRNVEVALTYGFVPILFPSHSPLGVDYLRALFSKLGI